MKNATSGLSRILSVTLFILFTRLFFFQTSFAQGSITGPVSVCEHTQVVYTAPTGYVSYTWGVSGGTGVASTNTFTVLWGANGAGTVSVILVDALGNTTVLTLNVAIYANPDASISFTPPPTCPSDTGKDHTSGNSKGGSCIKVCENTVMTFTALNVPSTNYNWVPMGGSPLSANGTNTYTVQWGAPGTGTLSLVVTNSAGCKDSDAVCFEIIAAPTAAFNTSNVCFGVAASFNNTSIGATSYSWNFGDPGSGANNTSNAFSPTHIFSAPGTYTVCLAVENDCHCTDTICHTITVDATPGPQIFCLATVCQGDTATYSTNASCSSYTWTVSANGTIISGAGTNTITVIWNTGPAGTVSLLVGGCSPTAFCTTPTVITIPIIPPTLTISGSTTPCEGNTECYTIPFFDGTIANWIISPSVPFTIEDCNKICVNWPNTPGTYTINVTYNNSFLGCGGNAALVVKVLPEMSVSGAPTVCSASPAFFNSFAPSIGGVNCNWTISPSGPTFTGNGTSAITVNWNGGTGFYTITATPTTGGVVCNASASFVVKVIPSPPAPAITGPIQVCPNSVQSYIASVGTNLTWSVVNGTLSSTSGNPVNVTWGASGPYSISVYQTDPVTNCQSSTTTLNVNSNLPLATPVITGPTTGCPEGTSNFSCTTTYPPSAGVTYTWAIGSVVSNGSIISGQGTSAITVQWANITGPVTVKLTVSVCNTNVNSNTITVTLQPLPNATISQSGIACPGVPVTLSVPSCGGCTYQWQLNAVNISGATNNTYATSAAGTYTATVTSSAGCSKSGSYVLVTNPAPSAIVNPTTINVCPGNPITGTFYAQAGAGWTFLWMPGGATTSSFTANATGTYTVTVTNSFGCTASTAVSLTNNPCPSSCTPDPHYSVNFTINQTTPNCNSVGFTSTATTGSTNPTWNFGDGNSGSGTTTSHTYTVAGIYFVTHCVDVPAVPTGTCTICTTKMVTIPVVAKFSANVCCKSLPVQFNNLTTIASGVSVSYSWNFGDPSSGASNTSTLTNPTHTFVGSGTSFTVTLTATSSTGCVSTYTLVVNVSNPKSSFTGPIKGCVGNAVTFTNTSVNTPPITYSWTFGDGGTSNLTNGTHTYAAPGTYTVKLTATNACGCTKNSSQTITIGTACCTGSLTASPPTPVCPGTNVTLTAPACGTQYVWSTGAITSVNTLTVTQTGTYSVVITDPNSCKCTPPPINVIVNPAPSTLITGNPEMCASDCQTLFATFSANYTYVWKDVGTGLTVSTNYYYSLCPAPTPGTYSYTVTITDISTGCSATSLPFTVIVHPNPTVSITTSGATTFCEGNSVTLTANPVSSGLSYAWTTGDNTPSILVTGGGTYTVTVTDNNGCTASAATGVVVHPKPDLCGFQCGCYTECAPFTINGPSGGTTYQWQLNGLNITGATNQNYTTSTSGIYSLIVTSSFGCADTTCDLDLTLTRCDSICSALIIDSVYCDSTGNTAVDYQVYNGSGYNINQWILNVIPAQPILVTNDTTSEFVHDGDTSAVHTTQIIGGVPGNQLCLSVSINRTDQYGNHIFCCQSDSVCFIIPKCPNTCAALIINRIYCTPTGYAVDYQVSNLTNTTMNEWIVSLYPPTPPIALSNNDVLATLPGMTTSTVHTLNITGAVQGQLLCFAITLQSSDVYGYQNCCCTADQKYCIKMPACTAPRPSLNIYPNPANDQITIENSGSDKANVIQIYDMMGEKVMEQVITDPAKPYFDLSIKLLNRGSYLVKLLRDNSVSQGIFVKE